MPALSPARIMEVGMGFWPAKVLLSAVELGLFTVLGANAMTGAELQRALGLHSRANPDFFDALLALSFLERDGDGPEARYRNTAETALFLDRNSPQFMGGFLEMANARLYPFWGDLTEGLRSGKPQNEIKQTGASMFTELLRAPPRQSSAQRSASPPEGQQTCTACPGAGGRPVLTTGQSPHLCRTEFDTGEKSNFSAKA